MNNGSKLKFNYHKLFKQIFLLLHCLNLNMVGIIFLVCKFFSTPFNFSTCHFRKLTSINYVWRRKLTDFHLALKYI